MKMIQSRIKKIVVMMLVIAISISSLPVGIVYADNNIGVKEALEDISSQIEKEKEILEEVAIDEMSEPSAGDWYKLKNVDYIAPSVLHIQVQKHLVKRYGSKELGMELPVPYINKDGKSINGRADIYLKEGKKTYIWEVKPYSYSHDPNKKVGLEQLGRYIAYDPNYVTGDAIKITGGTANYKKQIPRKKYIEIVEYEIPYTVQENGLIIYSFTRHSTTVPLPDTTAIPASLEKPEKRNATGELLETDAYAYQDDIAAIMDKTRQLLTVGGMFAILHTAINSTPDIQNSVSGTFCLGYEEYLRKVGPLLKKLTAVGGVVSGTTAGFALTTHPVGAAENDEYNKELARLMEINDDFELIMDVLFDDVKEEILKAIEADDLETAKKLIKGIQDESDEFDEAGEAQPPRDPLVIDLGETGIELHTLDNGVNFDLDNNGFAERTAWIGVEDGFLALDRNGNGRIDNGGELFGDQVLLATGKKSASGFEALAELDENEDGKVDAEDSEFDSLKVWIDVNHNGVSEAGELKSLSELNIVSISLEHRETSIVDDETGTRIAETADVELTVGDSVTTVDISEFWFPINASDTMQGDHITAGNVPDLEQAIFEDESGELYRLYYMFSQTKDIAERHYYLKQILYFLTGATDIASGSRGGNIDARDLRVIEQFMGREFVGVDGSNPNVNAASILKNIYSNIECQYYNIVNMNCAFGGYMRTVFETEDENGNKQLVLVLLNHFIAEKMAQGDDMDALVYDLGMYLKSYDRMNGTKWFDEYCSYYSGLSTHYAQIVQYAKSDHTYIGTDNNDSYYGDGGNDFIFGKAGADSLGGGDGSDIIYGGDGDDTIIGGGGNDSLYGDAWTVKAIMQLYLEMEFFQVE